MMKQCKRTLAAMLALVLLLSVSGIGALAATPMMSGAVEERPAGMGAASQTHVEVRPAARGQGTVGTAQLMAEGEEGVARIGITYYLTLQDAIDDALPGEETTITMVADIEGMTTADIATVSAGKIIILEMDGHRITLADGFIGCPVVNKGALTVTGPGTIDSANGYGAIWNGGTLNIVDGDFDVVACVAQVGETGYETLQAAIDAAQDGDTVTLVADETTKEIIEVNKSITIEGNNHAVNSTANRILWIDADDVTVTLHNIEFKSDVAERGVQVNVGRTGVVLNIHDCTVPGTYYAVNVCSDTSVTLNIDGSTIRGWGALNLWGDNYEVKVTNSTLIGHNDKSYSAAGWNGFGVVVLEGDTTGQTDEHVSGCHVVLDNCHIIASTAVNDAGNANIQKVILFNNPSTGNTVEITGDETIVEYEQGDLTPFCVRNGDENTLVVSGGAFSGDVSEYCVEDKKATLDEDGNYVIVEKDYVAQIGQAKYETVEGALAAAQDGDTVEIIKAGEYPGFTIPAGVTVKGIIGETKEESTVITSQCGTKGLGYKPAKPGTVSPDVTATVQDLWFEGEGMKSGLYVTATNLTVDGCKFVGMKRGIYDLCDNEAAGTLTFTNNTFVDVEIPVDGYWNCKLDSSKITITGNTFEGCGYIQLWDYAQFLAWRSGNTSGVKSAINAEITNNTGDVTLLATHCSWFVPSVIVTDEDTNVVYTRLVEIEGMVEGTTVKAEPVDGELTGFEDHTTATVKNGKLCFYYLPEGAYKVDVVAEDGTTDTLACVVRAPEGGKAYGQTLTLTVAAPTGEKVAKVGDVEYTTLQDAMDVAAGGEDKTVTILQGGEYAPITVPAGVTVQAAPGVDVVFKNTGSAQMLLAAGATLKDVTVDNTGNDATNWTKATAVGYTKGNGFTLDGCTILGADAGKGVAVLHCNDQEMTIKNCVIKDFKRGYYACGDNNALGNVNITGNTFENVEIPVDGYWGKPVTGKMTVTGNTFDEGSFIQLWDYTQYQAWSKGDTENVQSAINAEIKNNTGDVTVLATHCDWFVPSVIETDEDANVVHTRLVVVEGVPEGAKVTATPVDGELVGFEDHTTATLRGGKLCFYYLPDGKYKVEVQDADGEALTDLTMYAAIKAPAQGADKTLTLTPDNEQHEHEWDEGEQTKAPTCTEKGETTYTCWCGETKTEADIDATGHNTLGSVEHKDATCTEPGVVGGTYCTDCNEGKEAAEAVTEAKGHTEVVDEAVAATCTETGLTEGKHCSECDTVLVAQEAVEATGHTVVTDEAVAPTYTETGLTEGSHCSVCGEVLVAQTEVPTLTRPSTSSGSSRPSVTVTTPVEETEELEEPDVPLADKPFLFEDVAQDDWHYDAVKFAFDNDLMKGVTETRFAPTLETDRAMIVTMLYRMEKEPEATGASFADVADGQWYTQAVAWSVAAGIAKGYDNGDFGPEDKVTREQLALFLLRYAQMRGYDVTGRGALDSFADGDSVSDWALEATQWAVDAGLMKGDNGKLRPQDTATRAETAALFVRFIQAYAQVEAE